jgi:hypothetical protein
MWMSKLFVIASEAKQSSGAGWIAARLRRSQ